MALQVVVEEDPVVVVVVVVVEVVVEVVDEVVDPAIHALLLWRLAVHWPLYLGRVQRSFLWN